MYVHSVAAPLLLRGSVLDLGVSGNGRQRQVGHHPTGVRAAHVENAARNPGKLQLLDGNAREIRGQRAPRPEAKSNSGEQTQRGCRRRG